MRGMAVAPVATTLLCAVMLLGGCALRPYQPEPVGQTLLDVPFWPQQDYQCGPAALAMTLNASGVEVDPEALVDAVYLPSRRGSLQAEMLATPRRYGRIAYQLPADFSALQAAHRNEQPVLVMLNLGVSWWPVWHYAVVVGLNDKTVWLHSGLTPRLAMRRETFMRRWRAAEQWAMVTMPPQQLPQSLSEQDVAHTLAGLEQAFSELAAPAYQAAVQRWPQNTALRFGLANVYAQQHNWEQALELLQTLHGAHPDSAPIANNLALAYAQQGQLGKALDVLRPVLGQLDQQARWREVLEQTWYQIQATP